MCKKNGHCIGHIMKKELASSPNCKSQTEEESFEYLNNLLNFINHFWFEMLMNGSKRNLI